ncbi:MAG TPA: EAL domain-containing protein [Candidatus Paceibacterota bacterium]|nr:EAL domain-containing protein [Candidatus Paceibacterota bacterium]
MAIESLDSYKKYVKERLDSFRTIFAKASIGEYSEDVAIPEDNEEFAELATGIQVMIEVIRERIGELENEIADRKIIEERIRHQALHDPLTGLPNRKLLEERLAEVFQNAFRDDQKMAVVYFDLDRFKQINDVYGHQVGDMLLKEFAGRVDEVLPPGSLFARLGGDEFLVVLHKVKSQTDVSNILKRVVTALESPMSIESKTLFLSTSMGVAMFPRDGRELSTLVANSDVALLQAKHAGRNHFRFYRAMMNREASSRMQVVQELRHAVASEQMEIYYQPVVDFSTNRIMNAEALLRWRHPEQGLIEAHDFIPLAYDHGIMRMLGESTLRGVLQSQRTWQRQGVSRIRVAVNLSTREFTDRTFMEKLRSMLDEFEISPTLLEFEIVESLAMENIDLAKDRFKAFHKLGITIAIDDFGMGYSSLGYLKDLSVDKLKIDQSFVRRSLKSKEDRAIIQTIVALGQNLNLKVVGEGVETKEQLNLLRELGCSGVQGFRVARPMSGDMLARWVASSEPLV